jgi:hypothetical protein
MRLPLLLLLSLLAACGPGTAVPPDDDDSAYGDDDDATEPLAIDAVTFATSLTGAVLDGDLGEGSTELEGTFHLIYWTDVSAGAMACRQRLSVGARARFGAAMQSGCDGCDGQIFVHSVAPVEEQHDDACPALPADVDLSFLPPPAVTVPADLRTLSLVSTERLLSDGWSFGQAGLTVEVLEERYAQLGLRLEYLAFVPAGGWLDSEAGLGDVANGWGDPKGLPMLAVYSDPADETWGAMLDGPCFASSLWTIRLDGGAEPLPR